MGRIDIKVAQEFGVNHIRFGLEAKYLQGFFVKFFGGKRREQTFDRNIQIRVRIWIIVFLQRYTHYMNRYSNILFFFLGIFLLSACNDEDELPDEPVINEISYDSNSKELLINFTDGDGNFGLADSDTLPPYQAFEDTVAGTENPFHHNLWLDTYVKRNGEFELLDFPGTLDFRVPVLTPAGQNKQLRVRISYDVGVDLNDFAIVSDNFNYGDTVKFNVILVDRDLNQSNMAETEPVVFSD